MLTKFAVRRALFATTAIAAQFCLACAAQAEEQPVSDQSTVEEVVVTAMRRAEAIQDVPASITALSGEQLNSLNLTNSQDLAAQLPALNIIGPFGESSPQISVRGVGNNGFNANSVSTVGVYSDEVYLNQSVGHGFQLFDLERVELLRGPQGTLYGANATSGALNFISRKPTHERSFEGSVTAGSYGQVKVEAAGNLPLGETAALRLSGATNKSDGYRYNTYLKRDAAFIDDMSWRALLSVEPSSKLDVLFKLHGGRARNDGAQYEQQGLIDPATFGFCDTARAMAGKCTDFFGNVESPDVYSSASDLAGFENLDIFGGAVTANLALGWAHLTSITAIERTKRETQDELDAAPFDEFHDQIASDAHQFSQELRLTSDNSGPFSWIVGAFYFREHANELEPLPARAFGPGALSGVPDHLEGVYRYFESGTESESAFGDATWKLGNGFSLTGGLRYTHETMGVDYEAAIFNADGTGPQTVFTLNDLRAKSLYVTIDESAGQSSNVTTGRIVLEYEVNPDLTLYTSYARGFRGGNFNSGALFSSGEFTLVHPETLDAVEAGIKSVWLGGMLTFNASAYTYAYKDQQVTTVIGGQQLMANAASSSINGGEAEVFIRPSQRLRINLGLAVMDATYDRFISPTGADLSGNKLENAPDVSFNGLVSYTQPVWQDHELVWETDFNYKSDFYLDFSNNVLSKQPAYWLQNASVTLRRSDDRYELTLWGKNLWDEEYRVNWADLSGFGFNLNSYGAPRTVGLTLAYKTY